jgi:hypothetical protein
MFRRTFLSALGAVPLLGFLRPEKTELRSFDVADVINGEPTVWTFTEVRGAYDLSAENPSMLYAVGDCDVRFAGNTIWRMRKGDLLHHDFLNQILCGSCVPLHG